MARPSNTADRREKIAAALLAVMSSGGYEGATMVAVAKQAGLAPGLIHYHFHSKQEILIEAIRLLGRTLEQRYARLAETAASPRQRLAAFIDARLAFGDGANPEAVAAWVAIAAEAVRQPEVKAVFQAAMAAQRARLEQLIADYGGDSLTPDSTAHLAGVVLAAMEGAFLLAVTAADIMPKDYAAATVMQLVEQFVEPRRGGR